MTRLADENIWTPPNDKLDMVLNSFLNPIKNEQIESFKIRINHSLLDFEMFRRSSKLGKKRERVTSVKKNIQAVESLKIKDDEYVIRDYIQWKLEEIKIIKTDESRSRGKEDQWPIYFIKKRLFEIYDSYHKDILDKIKSTTKRSCPKSEEILYFINKASFASHIGDFGYISKIPPHSRDSLKQKAPYTQYLLHGAYKDARAHTLGILKEPVSALSKSRN